MGEAIWRAVAQGVLQGITEFLPVSSSGHLTLFQTIHAEAFEMAPNVRMALDVLLHAGTLLAILIAYRREFVGMIRHPIASDLKYLALATVPAAAVALIFRHRIEGLFEGNLLGVSFLINCAVLLIAEAIGRFAAKRRRSVGWAQAAAMGAMQAAAILPGLSRSGSAIAGGLATGLSRKRAADFAFLMAAPAVLGSLLMELIGFAGTAEAGFGAGLAEAIEGIGGWQSALAGFAAAAAAGFLAIQFMVYFIRRMSLNWFALYTGLIGGIYILWQFTNAL